MVTPDLGHVLYSHAGQRRPSHGHHHRKFYATALFQAIDSCPGHIQLHSFIQSFIHSISHPVLFIEDQCKWVPTAREQNSKTTPPTHSKTPTLWRFHCSVRTVYRGGDIDPKCEGGSELPNSPRGLAEKWICPKAQEGREKMGGMKAPVPCPLVGQTPHL